MIQALDAGSGPGQTVFCPIWDEKLSHRLRGLGLQEWRLGTCKPRAFTRRTVGVSNGVRIFRVIPVRVYLVGAVVDRARLAEGERFELSLGLPLSLISSQVPSTTQPPFR